MGTTELGSCIYKQRRVVERIWNIFKKSCYFKNKFIFWSKILCNWDEFLFFLSKIVIMLRRILFFNKFPPSSPLRRLGWTGAFLRFRLLLNLDKSEHFSLSFQYSKLENSLTFFKFCMHTKYKRVSQIMDL